MTNEKVQALNESMSVYISKLCEDLKAGHTETFKQYLSVASRFHRYTPSNQWLIAAQMPTATRVAGYNAWLDLGRQVKAGSKSLKIFAPMFGKRVNKESGEEERFVRGFKTVSVFDISQTEGKDLPNWFRNLGNDDLRIYDRLKGAMEKRGITVTERNLGGSALGLSYGGRVEIDSGLDPMNKALTLIHEFVHELLHKGSENRQLSKGVKECQAEAATFVVAQHFGVESPFSKDYLLNWGNDAEELKKNLSAIMLASREIIDILSDSVTEFEDNTTVTEEKIAA